MLPVKLISGFSTLTVTLESNGRIPKQKVYWFQVSGRILQQDLCLLNTICLFSQLLLSLFMMQLEERYIHLSRVLFREVLILFAGLLMRRCLRAATVFLSKHVGVPCRKGASYSDRLYWLSGKSPSVGDSRKWLETVLYRQLSPPFVHGRRFIVYQFLPDGPAL